MSILALLDEIRSIGQLGLTFSDNPYDRERYERLLRIAAGEYASISGLLEADIQAFFQRELGYITPKTGTNGAIFNEDGHVLLVQRSDNGRWCMPGGYAEVNLTAQENCRREVWEETGLEVEVGDLVDVFCILPSQHPQLSTHYIMVYLCKVTGGELMTSHETPVVGFYDHTTVTDWHSTHQERVKRAHHQWLAKKQG